MHRVVFMTVFVTVAVSVLSGVHWYLWVRLVRSTGLPPPWARAGRILIIALGLSLPLGMFVTRGMSFELSRHLAWLPFVWMGAMMLFFFWFLATDALRLLATQGARLTGLDLGLDAARRLALARILAGAGLAVVGLLTVVAVVGATGRPAVRDVEIPIPRLPAAMDGLTIVQVSDLHFGIFDGRERAAEIVEQVNALEPDLIAVTGDLIDTFAPLFGDELSPLADLRARHGVYFVTGNHEYYFKVDEWLPVIERLGMDVLANERVEIGAGDDRIYLAGVNDLQAGRVHPEHRYDPAEALAGRDPTVATVLLAHQPRVIRDVEGQGVDLILSGHTHEGQIWPFTYLVRLQQPYISGLYEHGDGTRVYVNPGTGTWGPPMRLGSENEITRVRLRALAPPDTSP